MVNTVRGAPVVTVPVAERGGRLRPSPIRSRLLRRAPSRIHHVGMRFDGMLALMLVAALIARQLAQGSLPGPLGWGLLLVGAACIAWRRRAPALVLAMTTSTFCFYQAFGYPHPPLPVAMLVSVYTGATRSPALTAAALSGAAMIAATVSKFLRDGWTPDNFDDPLIAYLLSTGAACALGYGVQLTRTRTELLQEQADRLAYAHAAHEQQSLLIQRNRIARDLHDVVSHQVAVITALAAGAGKQFYEHPERARTAITSIETAAREAMAEMRQLLRVLRPDEPARDEEQPSLGQLDDLAAQMGRAGLSVQVANHGARRQLPPGVELCAYRIVQEALTNALKHAGPVHAIVELRYEPDALDVRISDTGCGMPAQPGAGRGLVGMRERTALVGGRLEVGQSPQGGVRIRARLPIQGGDC